MYKILCRKVAARMELRYKDLQEDEDEEKDETVSHDGCLCCLTIEEPALQYWEQQKLELSQRFLEELATCPRVPKIFVVWRRSLDIVRLVLSM